MLYKPDWEIAKQRYDAFWRRDCIDRCALWVVSKKKGVKYYVPENANPAKKRMDIDYILDNVEKSFSSTYFAAEALPNYYPDLGPGIIAAFLDSEPEFRDDTVWFSEVIEDWDTFRPMFDENNRWWKMILSMTLEALKRGKDKYFVGVTDFHGAGDNLLNMRGSEKLCMDFLMYPDEVKRTLKYILDVLKKCYEETADMILKQQQGTTHWMGIYADGRQDVLQADIGALLSPKMFEEFFRDEFENYAGTLDRCIFHVDGPSMIRHLDMLLDIPKIDAIQWVPGDGQPEAIEWIPMLKRIRSKGKSLFIYSSAKNVEGILKELSPEGLYIHVNDLFEDEGSADDFIRHVEKWCCRR